MYSFGVRITDAPLQNSALAAGLGSMFVAACTSNYWCAVSLSGAP